MSSLSLKDLAPTTQDSGRGFAHVAAPSLPLNGMRELPLGVSSWVVSSAGEGDSDMDAATVYAHFLREMNKLGRGKQRTVINVVCFTQAHIDGKYLNEVDYRMLFELAPDVQHALEEADRVIREARDEIQKKIDKGKAGGASIKPAGRTHRRQAR